MSVEVCNESGLPVDERALVHVTRHVMDSMGVSRLADVALLLVDEDRMAEMHVQFMDLPGPTDVMSFQNDDLDLRGSRGVGHGSGPQEPDDEPVPTHLGDILLCPSVAEAQAREAGHSTLDELQLLCAHGVLHLLGYDHEEPEEHAEMFGLQARLLQSFVASGTAPAP